MGNNRKAAKAAKRGKPFEKGSDPRRHMNGSKSKAAVEFNKTLRELLITEGEKEQLGQLGETTAKLKKVEWLIKAVWNKAISGEAWAVQFIAERTEGKVTQPIDTKANVLFKIIYDEESKDK